MNKIKIYTTPFLSEESKIFEKFHLKEEFYILHTFKNYSEPIDNLYSTSYKFCLYGSPINSIIKTNKQKYFFKLLNLIGEQYKLPQNAYYSIYEKYL